MTPLPQAQHHFPGGLPGPGRYGEFISGWPGCFWGGPRVNEDRGNPTSGADSTHEAPGQACRGLLPVHPQGRGLWGFQQPPLLPPAPWLAASGPSFWKAPTYPAQGSPPAAPAASRRSPGPHPARGARRDQTLLLPRPPWPHCPRILAQEGAAAGGDAGEAQGGGGSDGAPGGAGQKAQARVHKPGKEQTHSGPRGWMEPCCGVNVATLQLHPCLQGVACSLREAPSLPHLSTW